MQQTKQPLRTAIRWRYLDLLDWVDQQHFPRIAIVVILLTIVSGSALVGRLQSGSGAAAVPTPQLPIIVIRREPAAVVPAALPAPAQLVAYQPPPLRYVTAWAAPGGDVLGPIPEPATSALLGRWGDGWVATSWQGGTVWIRAADIGLNLANLAPQIAPAPAYVSAPDAPQAAPAVEQQYQPMNEPPPAAQPPEQPEPAPVIVAPQPVPVQQPPPPPAPAPAQAQQPGPSDVERNWIQEQLRMEHCIADKCYWP